MIATGLLLLGLQVVFYFIGLPISKILLIRRTPKTPQTENFVVKYEQPIATLTGLAISLSAASAFVSLDANLSLLVLGLAGISAISLGANFRKAIHGLTSIRVSKLWAWITPALAIVLWQKDFLAQAFAYRTGPDQFGWSTAALQLAKGDSYSKLQQRITTSLEGTPVIDAFQRPVPNDGMSINQIPSWTDQIASEFLLGAHRTGAPGLMAGITETIGIHLWPAVYVAMAVLAMKIVADIIYEFLEDKEPRSTLNRFVAITFTLSFPVISVSLEGGFGQLLTLPFFLLAFLSIYQAKNYPHIAPLAVTLMIMAAMSSYLDLLYFAGPFLLVLFTALLATKRISLKSYGLRDIAILLAGIVLSWPILSDLLRLTLGPITNPQAGGWHQGRVPLPSNIFGYFSSLPVGDYELYPRTPLSWTIDIVLTLTLFGLLRNSQRETKIVIAILGIAYLYLMYSVYFQQDSPNNYRIWKFSMYSTILAFPLVSEGLEKPKAWRVWRGFSARRFAGILLIASMGISSLIYQTDWIRTRNFTLTSAQQNFIANVAAKYDIVVSGGIYGQELAMYGDIRFGAHDRGYKKEPNRSTPPRKLAVLLPRGQSCDYECSTKLLGVPDSKIELKGKTFTVWTKAD